jgi:hypothetical protein
MKLEVGKSYRTRGNQKAKVLQIVEGQQYRVIGMVFDDLHWWAEQWTIDGRYVLETDAIHDLDLIEEWREPKTGTFWVNVYPFKIINISRIFDSKNEADDHANQERIACIEVKWTEGDGL